MGTSTIDGTIEAVDIKRKRGKFTIFRTIRFRLDNGAEKTVTKALVADELANILSPGTSGRFYLFTAVDQKGVHGIRSRQGETAYAWVGGNEKAMRFMFLLLLATVVLMIAITGDVGLLPFGIMILSAVCWYLYRKARIESRRQFDADSGYAASAASPDPIAPAAPA
ncbi:hypothetical protein [Allosphingosinicella sp.]|uniref:hypothetical protein n=1 Tax=Allosphingosinicella sp. TaxID=2823234 RepID=UPI002FC14250